MTGVGAIQPFCCMLIYRDSWEINFTLTFFSWLKENPTLKPYLLSTFHFSFAVQFFSQPKKKKKKTEWVWATQRKKHSLAVLITIVPAIRDGQLMAARG